MALLLISTICSTYSKSMLRSPKPTSSKLRHLAQNILHIRSGEGAQRLRAYISKFAGAQSDRCHRNIIWRLDNCDDVVLTKRPKHILYGRSSLLGSVLESVSPLRAIFDVPAPLVCEVCKHDIGRHAESSLYCAWLSV